MASPVWELRLPCSVRNGSKQEAQSGPLLEEVLDYLITPCFSAFLCYLSVKSVETSSLSKGLAGPCLWRCPIGTSENAKVAMKQIAAMKPLLDDVIKSYSWRSGSYSLGLQSFFLSLCFVSLLKSTTALVFKPRAGQWHGFSLPYFFLLEAVLSSPLCLQLLGKVPFTLWRCLLTMEQIPCVVFCCFPHSGKLPSLPVIFGADGKISDGCLISPTENFWHTVAETDIKVGKVYVSLLVLMLGLQFKQYYF